MEKIYSKVNPDVLLHVVNRMSDISDREDVAPPRQWTLSDWPNLQNMTVFKP